MSLMNRKIVGVLVVEGDGGMTCWLEQCQQELGKGMKRWRGNKGEEQGPSASVHKTTHRISTMTMSERRVLNTQ